MLKPRIIPCLLLSKNGLIKTVRFRKPTYIGDPINVISIFNEFEVDEIILLDIFASIENRPPPFAMLEKVANECLIPLTYGGGIRSAQDAAKIFKIGVEKIVLNSGLFLYPQVIKTIIEHFGSQSVVASLDAKPKFFGKGYKSYIKRGKKCVQQNIVDAAKFVEDLGVGEIFLQAIHRDGTYAGFDLALVQLITKTVSIPVIACGGAKSRENLIDPIFKGHANAVSAGSLFVYQSQSGGVLINFPTRTEINSFLQTSTKDIHHEYH